MVGLVSTTLSGNSEHVIGDALASVAGMVDKCIVIDTGITDRTLDIARAVAGDKLLVRQWPWRDDFAAARNFALQCAEEAGARWAITVDTDERILFKPQFTCAELENNADRDVFVTYSLDRTYTKERILSTGRGLRWEGPIHENVAGTVPERIVLTLNVTFTEVRKSQAQAVHKNLRDVAILRNYAAAHPEVARWQYYLGLTLHNMLRHEEAIPHLRKAAELEDWSGYHAQLALKTLFRVLGTLERWDEAAELCEEVLVRVPGETIWAHFRDMARHKGRLRVEYDLPA